MDKAILGLTIVMMFSIAHERFLEFWRGIGERWAWAQKFISEITVGPIAMVLGMGLAYVTNANLLEAFQYSDGEVRFFHSYLEGPPTTLYGIAGCLAMGLAVSLGSTWWHDIVKGLVDLRASLQAVRPTPEKLLAEAIVPLPPTTAHGRQGLL